MKRILAIVLCLCLLLGVTACKPDNITYPAEIIGSDEGSEQTNTDLPKEEPETNQEEPAPQPQAPAESPAEEGTPSAEEPAAENKAQEAPAPSAEEEEVPLTNPLAAETFAPSKGVENTLPLTEFVNTENAVSVMENRTIEFYTADDVPAFTYINEKGQSVSEWKWMEQLASKQGFILKYSIKDQAVSLKAQRTALYAGKKLSLVQMSAHQAGVGMTLTRSAAQHINKEIPVYGISKTVLTASNDTLFAPVGNVNALWYNTALMPANTDPAALAAAGSWTVEQFKTVHSHSITMSAQPLKMEETLAWATLSGKSPLTLVEGKLDSNIYAKATQEVWSLLQKTNQELIDFVPVPEVEYTLKNSNVTMQYSAVPEAAEGITFKYAPLPATAEGALGTVTYIGTYFALPKYSDDADNARAALTFTEYWCDRYTETIAARLKNLGISGNDYEAYTAMAEQQGHLILHQPEIETLLAPYLQGLTDATVDMDKVYGTLKKQFENILTTQNLYY